MAKGRTFPGLQYLSTHSAQKIVFYFSQNRAMVRLRGLRKTLPGAANRFPVPAKIKRRNTVLMELAAKTLVLDGFAESGYESPPLRHILPLIPALYYSTRI